MSFGRRGKKKRASPGRAVEIVVTPSSGDGRALVIARDLKRSLSARGYRPTMRSFSDVGELDRWAASRDPACSYLVCVGGDSTIGSAARAALRLSVPLVPVPSGFGNVFARVFGHPEHVEAVADLIERGEIQEIDVGVNGREVVLCHRSFGFLADVEERFEQQRQAPRARGFRHLFYYVAALRTLADTPLASIRVEVDGRPVADGAVLVTVANVETYRGFLSLTPTASPLDGLFDVFVIPRMSKARLLLALLKLMLHVPGRWRGVDLFRGRRVRVTVEGQPPEELHVVSAALPVLVPPGSIDDLEHRRLASLESDCRRDAA
jgi:diacylglycerol kinase (ATP)